MNSNRLLSLDILRGITVAGMILVNNGWGESFEMLQHAKWNGMTPCDLVFPFFPFLLCRMTGEIGLDVAICLQCIYPYQLPRKTGKQTAIKDKAT